MNYVAVASTTAVQHYCPEGFSPHSFRKLPFIAFNRKDDLQSDFICRSFRLRQAHLKQCFVPSSEGQVRAVLAGWGASVVPELLVRPLLAKGQLINLIPEAALPVELYWHCWNLDSDVLNRLSKAIIRAAKEALQ